MSNVLRRLFVLNPIYEESTRAWRKFFRVAGGPGKGLSYFMVVIIALVYTWILLSILLTRDHAEMIATLLFVQLFFVTLIMPMSVYGAISGERERTTWEALILTRLTPGQIVVGKLLWRLCGLLILMALFLLPILLCLTFNDNSSYSAPFSTTLANELPIAEFMTLAWGINICSFGLWVSANTKRSVTSAALIFISLLALLVLIPTLASMVGGGYQDQTSFSGNPPMWILMHVNAFYALIKMVSGNMAANDPTWGGLQTVAYLAGAAIFIFATYRSLLLWEERKNRIG